jgi:HEAT repeat protein
VPRRGELRATAVRTARAALFIAAACCLGRPAFAQLTPAELGRLGAYGEFWEHADAPLAQLPADRQRGIADAVDRARRDFAGRGRAVAAHFLRHTDYRIRNEAYWFVLGALGDADAAVDLVRALSGPPPVASGVMPRYEGEIGIALENLLASPTVAESPAVTAALVSVIDASTSRTGPPDLAIALLGRCRTPEARAALTRFASARSPQVRALAAQALGSAPVAIAGAAAPDTAEALVRMLERDANPEARAQAAASLGRHGGDAARRALTGAADREATPPVVDAIVLALDEMGAPLSDPATCRHVVEHAFEPQTARACFERWRASVTIDAVRQAALEGGPVLRILAIEALIGPSSKGRLLVPGATPPDVDAALQPQLLESIRDLLSTTTASAIVPWMAQQALWQASGHDTATALAYADGATTLPARYAASVELHRRDPTAYAAVRRPGQLVAASSVALTGVLLALVPGLRRAGLLVVMTGLAWALWTWRTTAVRELPPPPLAWLTVPAIALLSAGASLVLVSWIGSVRRVSGARRAILLTAGVVLATLLAFVVTGWSRLSRTFPVVGEGLESIVEPIAAAVLACVWAGVLVAADLALGRRARPAQPADSSTRAGQA